MTWVEACGNLGAVIADGPQRPTGDRLLVSLVSTLLLTPERGLVHYPEACGQRRVVSDVDVTHRTLVN